MAIPKVGYTESGYSFLGGNPNDESRWLKVGSEDSGYKFKGGDPNDKKSWEPLPTASNAIKTAIERGLTMETRPTIYGAGAGAASVVRSLSKGVPLSDSLSIGKNVFSEARESEIKKQSELQKRFPIKTGAFNVASSIPSALMMPSGTIGQAAKAGLAYGAGQAIGTAESPEEAAGMTALGGGLGVGSYGVGKGIKAGYDYGKELASKIPMGGVSKLFSSLTGIPETLINTYNKSTDAINKVIKKYGDNIPTAVDDARAEINLSISKTKEKLHDSISNAIKEVDEAITAHFRPSGAGLVIAGAKQEPVKKIIPIGTITTAIKDVKDSLHPALRKEEIGQIQDIIDEIITAADKDGFLSFNDLFEVQKKLQDYSKGSFLKDGKIFVPDHRVATAARAGYDEARQIVNSISPTIKKANNQYHRLHEIEKKINPNVLAEGKPEASFLAAGAGENKRLENILNKIGQITKTKPVEKARSISTARAFGNAGLLPQGPQTGYALLRPFLGAGGGAALAKQLDVDPAIGSLIGAASISPMALKAMINTKNVSGKAINKAIEAISSPKAANIINRIYGDPEKSKENIDAIKRRLMSIGGR